MIVDLIAMTDQLD